MTSEIEDADRRRLLTISTVAVGGVGAAMGSLPFLASFLPSAKTKAIGAPVEVDIANLKPGQLITVEWRGKPVWILSRTDEMVSNLAEVEKNLSDPGSGSSIQPEYASNEYRSLKPEHLIVVGICTHLGCSPSFKPEPGDASMGGDWMGGFYCPCHGSRFDLAGRVYAGVPAPTNLEIPPYQYLSDTRVLVGADEGAA